MLPRLDKNDERELRRLKARVTRQERALIHSRNALHALIRVLLRDGHSPTRIAKAAGYHISRVSQIGAEGGISVADIHDEGGVPEDSIVYDNADRAFDTWAGMGMG